MSTRTVTDIANTPWHDLSRDDLHHIRAVLCWSQERMAEAWGVSRRSVKGALAKHGIRLSEVARIRQVRTNGQTTRKRRPGAGRKAKPKPPPDRVNVTGTDSEDVIRRWLAVNEPTHCPTAVLESSHGRWFPEF